MDKIGNVYRGGGSIDEEALTELVAGPLLPDGKGKPSSVLFWPCEVEASEAAEGYGEGRGECSTCNVLASFGLLAGGDSNDVIAVPFFSLLRLKKIGSSSECAFNLAHSEHNKLVNSLS
jgi:hypothetical protein